MANDWNYIPIFKDNIELMAELSNEEFGTLVRAAMCELPCDNRPEGFTDIMYMSYKMLVSQVNRVYRERETRIKVKKDRTDKYRRRDRNDDKPRDNYQSDDIDPDEALRIALERSFGEDEE